MIAHGSQEHATSLALGSGNTRPWRLDALLRADVNACLLERQLEPSVTAAFRRWTEAPTFTRRVIVDTDRVDVRAWVERLPSPPEPGAEVPGLAAARHQLADDIAELAGANARLTGASRQKVTVALVDDNGCAKFHSDFMTLRAVVTYAGPGTQYLPEDAVDRASLGRLDEPPVANRQICRDSARVVQAGEGDVFWLKGMHWTAAGAVHRSPPLRGTGQRRLLLKVNEASS